LLESMTAEDEDGTSGRHLAWISSLYLSYSPPSLSLLRSQSALRKCKKLGVFTLASNTGIKKHGKKIKIALYFHRTHVHGSYVLQST